MPYKRSTRPTHSGIRNVYWDASRGQWYVRLTVKSLTYTAGRYFDDKEEAGRAASALRQKHGIPDIDQPFAKV